MPLTDALVPEFDHEMATTRRVLERVPDAQFAWKPHDKSMTLGQLSSHLASIPFWCTATLRAAFLDLDTIADGARPSAPASRQALLDEFDHKVAAARGFLAKTTDAELMAPWTLKRATRILHHAAGHGAPQLRAEPFDPPSWPAHRLSAPQ